MACGVGLNGLVAFIFAQIIFAQIIFALLIFALVLFAFVLFAFITLTLFTSALSSRLLRLKQQERQIPPPILRTDQTKS